jgi:Flagellar assembly protein T, C-terminal domain
MRANLAALCLAAIAGAGVCYGQSAPATPSASTLQPVYTRVYCSGFVKDSKLPDDLYVVSGEQVGYKVAWAQRENVYLNRGSDHGVKVGDRFTVVRRTEDPDPVEWFKGQTRIAKAMGVLYSDIGQLQVVSVLPKTSVAEVIFSCNYVQRGDIARPFEERPAPPFKEVGTFDHFAPVSGKPVGTVVTSALTFQQSQGQGMTVYVNLGAAQGVKVGDYLRLFRYQGKLIETVPQTKGYAYQVYGFGSSPARYEWKDLPREVLGEGIVLNASRNAATVFVTLSSAEIYPGDNVEIE